MNIEKIISTFPTMRKKELNDWKDKAERVLRTHPKDEDALRILSNVEAELSRKMLADRIRVPPLWWEPHDPKTPEFNGYEAADSTTPVATIFKSATHTGTRKAVYSVRIGDLELPMRFEKVDQARQAGSEAWEQGSVT